MTGLDAYRDQLEASGIPTDVAARCGVRAVTSSQARDAGFAGNGLDGVDLSGLLFEYRDPTSGKAVLNRLRPAVPVDGRKYLQPTGSRNRLYLPGAIPQQLGDTRFDAIMVEGEKKCLSVVAAADTKYLAVGLGGVWNWRTSDKEKRPEPDRPATKTVRVNGRAIEDFDTIAWAGRRVFVVFDSDATHNPKVRQAEDALIAELRRRRALPFVVTLPPAPSGAKQGLDDVLAAVEPAARLGTLQKLLAGAAPRRRQAHDADRALDLVYEPAAGYMRAFDEYVDAATDAPALYRPFTALATLAAVIGRNVTVPFGPGDLALNLYVAILGQSSFLHKTTNIAIAKRLITAVKPDIICPDDFTPERFIDLLQKTPQAFLAWPEFAGFLARSQRDYQGGSRELLMELYDAPDTFRRELKNQTIRIERPSLTILAASATSWLSDQLKGGDLRSGFLNRFAFVLAETKAKSYPLPVTPDMHLKNAVVLHLGKLAAATGEADLRKIRTSYTAWYADLEREAARADQPEIVSAFYTRLSITAIKIAVLLELASSRQLVVSPAALEEAIILTDYLRAVIRHLLRVEFAPSESAKRIQRVQAVVSKHPGIKRAVLMRKTGYDKRQITEAIETLVEQAEIYTDNGGHWPC